MGETVPEQAPALGRTRYLVEALVGSGLFTGYFPIAPATVTSLFVLLPAYFLVRLPLWHALVIVVLFFVGVPIATDLEKVWGRDPGRVTIDEIVGTLITFFLIPVSAWGLVPGFFLWRFFDIVKLPFIDRSQRLPGGWGVMADDVLAGICANLTLRVLLWAALRFVPNVGGLLVR
jgi:phosphatidylglycerophosphatase A